MKTQVARFALVWLIGVIILQTGCASSSNPTAVKDSVQFVPKTFADSLVGSWVRYASGYCLLPSPRPEQKLQFTSEGILRVYSDDTLSFSTDYELERWLDKDLVMPSSDTSNVLITSNAKFEPRYQRDCPFANPDSQLLVIVHSNDSLQLWENCNDCSNSVFTKVM